MDRYWKKYLECVIVGWDKVVIMVRFKYINSGNRKESLKFVEVLDYLIF